MNHMNQLKRQALTAALSASMILSPVLSGSVAWAAAEQGQESWYPAKEHAGINYADRAYTGYDYSRLEALIDEFDAAASLESSVSEDVLSLYHQIVDEIDAISTQFALLQISYYTDVTDEALSAQLEELEVQVTKLTDRALLSIQTALSGPFGEIIQKEMTDRQLEDVTDYKAMSEREIELAAEEIRLVQQYDQSMMQTYEVTYEGETWTEEKLDSQEPEDADAYNEIYTLLLKEKNQAAGAIYQDLIKVRTEIAEENGYSSYADYAYEEVYNRDFTAEEIRNLYPVVKKNIAPLCTQAQLLFYADLDASDDESLNVMVPGEQILDTIEPYVGQVDPALTEAFDYMREHHLYDIEDSDTKMSMGFTIGLPSTGDAFIFNQPYGRYQDYWTMIHEFGHYNAIYHSTVPTLYENVSLDVAEIHSQGLEVLFFDYMDDMFGSSGDIFKMSSLANMLYAVTEGFKYDEFQQTVYANPDMTLDEMNQLALRLETEYSGLPMDPEDAGELLDPNRYYWVQVPHTFQSPMYYISYATSAMAALDIWGESLEDREGAVDKYMTLTAMGMNIPYKEALESSGLRNMLEKDTIVQLSDELYQAIRSFSGSEDSSGSEEITFETALQADASEADGQEQETDADGQSSFGAAAYAGLAAVFVICAAGSFLIVRRKRK